MKSITNDNIKPKTFPHLSTSGDEVVLFTSPLSGMVVANLSTRGYKVGHHTSSWDSARFIDFEGSVTLSND